MKNLLTILSFAFLSFAHAQSTPANNSGDKRVYTSQKVEALAEFNGGDEKMREFLKANFAVPKQMVETYNTASITSTFVVETDGTLSDIKIIKDTGFNTEAEMIRVLKLMPAWLPAELNGKKVRFLFTLSYWPNGGN